MDHERLTAEVMELASAYLAGEASDDQRARLERLLEDNAEARAIYLRIADDTVTLNDVRSARLAREAAMGAAAGASDEELEPVLRRGKASWPVRIALGSAIAASIAAAAAWALVGERRDSDVAAQPAAQAAFARIVSLSNVQWRDDGQDYREWDRLRQGDALLFDAGSVEVLYDNGVQFVVEGPADCTFINEKKVLARSGKLVARVSPEALGFRIVTPHAAVIDRGTSFGVTIDPDHQTDVVVYEGKVDLAVGAPDGNAGRRLEAGEALRIGSDGRFGRIASVAADAFLLPPRWSDGPPSGAGRVITAVADNLKSSQTAKYYRVVGNGFREDCQAYVDRRHQWNGLDDRGIPPFLARADYVMTFNDDKVQADLGIAVTVAQPARLYILFDDRAPSPQWLTESFADTGWDLGIDEGYDDVEHVKTAVGAGKSIEYVFSVWAKDVKAPTTVLLGPLREVRTDSHPRDVLLAMYGIAATPVSVRVDGGEK